ncbi:hypothetical protein HMI54_013701 [Coelomomyces lativittatus]|nr:hypothetical protein HMI54_013701 [Coelomomyces lativittatus]
MLSNANSMVVTEVAEEDPPPLEPIPFFSTPSQFTKKPTQVKTEIHTSPKKKNFNNCKKSEGYLGLKKGFFSFNKETDISKKSVHPEVQPTKKKDGLQTLQPTTRPHVLEEVQQAMLQHDPSTWA